MNRVLGVFTSFVAIVMLMASCNLISSMIHDDDVVAKVGKEMLYRSEVESAVPEGLSEEDSVNFVRQYVNAWASDILFVDMARTHLSKEDQDVTSQLEEYRKSLLKYRYQELYISERLDTFILESQIRDYYESHKDLFELERPVLKVIYIDIVGNASAYRSPDDIDSAAIASALKYFDYSENWMDAAVLAREFGMDYEKMLSMLSGNTIRESQKGKGDEKIAFVLDLRRSGTAPYEYCRENIRDILLNQRKRSLSADLEQGLLKDALRKKQLVIY